MRRFYLSPDQCNEPRLLLLGDEAHHAARVLRLEVGDKAMVLDGAGRIFTCIARSVAKSEVLLEPVQTETFPEPSPRITLVCAMPKGGSFDDILAQAIELGVDEIVPLATDHGNVRFDAKQARAKHLKWQGAAVESIKQCGAAWLPEVAPVLTVGQALGRTPPKELVLLADLRPGAKEVGEAVQAACQRLGRPPVSTSIWIGPEGDFSARELELLQHARAVPVTLGSRVLRCPTAAIAAISVLAHELRLASSPSSKPLAPTP